MSAQFSLLGQRRFAPLFITQALGALNDNVFKNALILLIAFGAGVSDNDSNLLINAAAGLFIVPFFLFSAQAGQLADTLDKATLIRRVKLGEIGIMALATVGFVLSSIPVLLVALALMGTQSAFFGPAKYAILPQHVDDTELVGANGLIEMGTFLAILVGTLAGGLLIGLPAGPLLVCGVVLGLATLGYLAARAIPSAPPLGDPRPFNWNIWTESRDTLGALRGNPTLLHSVLGVSWFWFFGATYLTQLPNYVRLSLGGNEQVVTLLLALFSIGIAVGSLLCERLSGKRVELGLVPVGSIGMTWFAIDLFFADGAPAGDTLLGASAWLAQPGSWRVVADVPLLGAFGGLYIVPLYALIQQRAEPAKRARVIAANNILNAAFMTVSAVGCALLLGKGLSIPQLFLTVALMNAAVAVFIYTLVPEFFLRFVIWVLIHLVYRVRGVDLDRIPADGPVMLACNHVSFVDSLIIGGMVRQPVRFVMYHKIYNTPGLRLLFDIAGAVPIAPAKEDPAALEAALDRIADYLADGEVVCVFPEGALTPDGELQPLREGLQRMVERTPAPVVPLALRGLWGSWFSRAGGKAMAGWPRRFWSRVALAAGPPIAPEALSMEALQADIDTLRGAAR